MYVSADVDDPLMVTALASQPPDTPGGNPLKLAPVAPMVEYVMGVMAVLMQAACALVPAAEDSVMVLSGVVVMTTTVDSAAPVQVA